MNIRKSIAADKYAIILSKALRNMETICRFRANGKRNSNADISFLFDVRKAPDSPQTELIDLQSDKRVGIKVKCCEACHFGMGSVMLFQNTFD
jgi:hypothetical protein